MSGENEFTNEEINDIAFKVIDIIASDVNESTNDMYSVFQHAFAIFLVGTSYDRDHLLTGVEMFKNMCVYYFDKEQKK